MCETTGPVGFSSRCQSPKRPLPIQERKTPYEVMQDVIAIEKANKMAERYNNLKNTPASELTPFQRLELSYLNALKVIAKMSEFNTVIH